MALPEEFFDCTFPHAKHRVKAKKAIARRRKFYFVHPGEVFEWNEALVLGMTELEYFVANGHLPEHIYVEGAFLPRPVVEKGPSLFSLAGLLDAAGFVASVAFAPVHWTASCLMLMASHPVLAVVSATHTAYKTTCALLYLPSTIVQGLECMADVLIAAYW